MLRVALTGGVASGKSAVAAVLERMGAAVSRSDEVGRAMMQPGEAVFAAIAAHFGPGVVRTDGQLDRRELARLAYDEGRVEELNAIVHPVVIAAERRWMDGMAAQGRCAVAVVESALVLETAYGGVGSLPWRAQFDTIVLVTAADEVRLGRYVRRVLASDQNADAAAVGESARRMLALQMPEAEKRRFAGIVMENDGTMEELEAKAEALYVQLRLESEGRG